MRAPAATLLLCLVSGAVGAFFFSLLESPKTGGAHDTVTLDGTLDGQRGELRGLRERVMELEKALDESRSGARLLATAPPPERSIGPARRGEATPVASSSPAAMVDAGGEASRSVRRKVGDPPVPPPNREKLDAIEGSREDPGFRTKWMFARERDVLDEFGLPDRILVLDGAAERWIYDRKHKPDVLFDFHRARVIRVYP